MTWKKQVSGIAPIGYLFGDKFLPLAGTTYGDWAAVGLGRMGYPDDYAAYLGAAETYVTEKYKAPERLDRQKATEWHRISLAILALGGDPTKAGTAPDGLAIDLIADGVYGRTEENPLGVQGTNGLIWGLIALDALRYRVPDGAYYTRDTMITEILSAQTPDGGFSLDGGSSDIDITAMALQAMAPYYNSEQVYDFRLTNGAAASGTVRQSVDKGLTYLSSVQTEGGDFEVWGAESSESIAQVIVALCALGIDPARDSRFVKNNGSLLDGLLEYRQEDGRFVHALNTVDLDPALTIASDAMASDQALYALAAYCRYSGGLRSLYDFRPELPDALKAQIAALDAELAALPENSADADKAQVENSSVAGKVQADKAEINMALAEDLFARYLAIPVTERSYVYEYHRLADAMEVLGIENNSEFLSQYMGENTEGNGTVFKVFAFVSELENSKENSDVQ